MTEAEVRALLLRFMALVVDELKNDGVPVEEQQGVVGCLVRASRRFDEASA